MADLGYPTFSRSMRHHLSKNKKSMDSSSKFAHNDQHLCCICGAKHHTTTEQGWAHNLFASWYKNRAISFCVRLPSFCDIWKLWLIIAVWVACSMFGHAQVSHQICWVYPIHTYAHNIPILMNFLLKSIKYNTHCIPLYPHYINIYLFLFLLLNPP